MAFVAVHLGAGRHNMNREPEYRRIVMDACRAALAVLSDEKSTINGVAAALRVMEDDGITNAGLGSNLTHSGTVECEAAVMETCSGMSGCVGAVSGVKNPSEVAVALLRGQQDGLLSLGRLPPSFIVGDGARKWAIDHGITVTGESDLITASAQKSWLNWTSKLQKTASSGNGVSAAPSESSPHSKRRRTHDGNDDEISDTVGVICVVGESIAVGASSGGILLKQPGRIGPAACVGAGIWCGSSVGVCTSGTGEYIMKSLLALQVGKEVLSGVQNSRSFPSNSVKRSFEESFMQMPCYVGCNQSRKAAGVLVYSPGVLTYAHNSPTFCIGWATSEEVAKPHFLISQSTDGKLVAGEFPIRRFFN